MKVFVGVHEAREIILSTCETGEEETVVLSDAYGRTLARPVLSSDPVPPFDNSAMDGFALRAADVRKAPMDLRVIDDIPAGRFPMRSVTRGTCSRIMTGAPMPEGADTVVPVEDTERIDDAGGSIRIRSVPSPRQNVRYMGEHVRPGTTVFLGGELLTPPAIGMLATLGVDQVGVRRRPTVAIVATGDELVEPGEMLEPGKIRNSNGPALAAQTGAAGAEVRAVLLARDTPGDLERCLDSALQHDVVVLSGGVSVGEHDHVKETLVRRGVDLLFWKVRQKPGKPLAFGKGPRSIVFGLPGNPVSSSVCFDQYVRPAILSMMGRRDVLRKLVPARLVSAVRKRKGLYHFVRATATFESGSIGVQPTGPQGSNLYTSMLDAECLIHLPEEVEDPAPGTLVEVEWLTW